MTAILITALALWSLRIITIMRRDRDSREQFKADFNRDYLEFKALERELKGDWK